MCFTVDWRSEKMRRANDDVRVLYFYLLTAPHRNRVGLYYLPAAYGAFDLGWTEQKFATGMEVLQKLGLVRYDASAHVVWVETLSEVPVNPNQTKAFLTALKEVPDTPLFRPLLERLRAAGKKHLAPLVEHLEERLKNVERQEEPFRKPVGEPSAEPDGKRSVEPSEEPLGKPFRQPLTERLKEPLAEPLREPFGERLSERLERRLAKTLPEPINKPFREPFGEPFPEPTAERSGEPSEKPLSERLGEPLRKPLTEPLAKPLAERLPEPFGEPFAEPFAERLPKPFREPLAEPFREPFAKPLPKPLNGHGEESSRSAVTAPQSPASGAFPVQEPPAGPFPEPFAQPFGEPSAEAGSSPSPPPTPPSSTPLTLLSFPQSQDKGVREKEKNKIPANSEKQQDTDTHAITQKEKQNIYENKKNIPQTPHGEGDVWKQIMLSSSKESNGSMYNGTTNSGKNEYCNDPMEKEVKPINTANPSREDYNTNRPTIATVVDLYHHLCPSLPRMKGLTAKRKQNIERLLDRYGIDAIRTVFEKAETSDFLSGRNGKWRGCSLDWLIREENFVKVWEGKYDNRLPRSIESVLDAMMGKPLTPDDFPPEQARLMREFNIDPEELFRNFGKNIVGAVGG